MTGYPPTDRRRAAPAFVRVALPALVLALASVFPSTANRVAAAGLSPLHVSGNLLIDGNGNTVVLHGVNRSGSEYACIQGWGIFDGPDTMNDDSQVPLMKSWGVNEVNIGLNEDCWLGINGVPTAYGGTNYRNAIIHETQTLESAGIYPVLSLFWAAPGTQQATGQIAMPDADHASAFWQSVASTFAGDPDVIFRLMEEPFPDGNTDSTAAWQCWLNGGSFCSEGYPVVGMQSLVNTIRAAGATNIIQLGGVEYANSMSQFLTYAPTDPAGNVMGVVDVYPNGNICGDPTCYNTEYAPVIARYPFMAGEFGESVDGTDCTTTGVDTLMSWFDTEGAGYSAWSWDTWGQCLQLITDYTTGNPNGNWGTDYKNHLATLGPPSPGGQTTTTSLSSSLNPSVYGQQVSYSATVSPSGGSGTPTGTVDFQDGGTDIAGCSSVTLSSGTAVCTPSTPSVGTHTITAVYSGDGTFSASTSGTLSQVVNRAATSVSLTASPAPSIYNQPVTLTARVTGEYGGSPTGSVAFLNGSTVITGCSAQPVTAGVAVCTTSSLSSGNHTISARYGGDTNFTASSGSTGQSVTKASTRTALTSSANPSTFGRPVTFTAAVTGAYGGTPTGTVAFKADGKTVCSAARMSSARATCTTSALSRGSHTITAAYSGDGNFLGGTSSGLIQQVN